MKTHFNNQDTLGEIIKNLNAEWKGVITTNTFETILTVNNPLGKGCIKAIELTPRIKFIDIEGVFYEPFKLTTNTNNNKIGTLIFAYCSLGSIEYKFKNQNNFSTINTYQSAILHDQQTNNITFSFKRPKLSKFSMILVERDTSEVQKNELTNTLFSFFSAKDLKKDFHYLSSYNFKIAEQIEKLNNLASTELVRRVLWEGTIFQILGMQLEQHMMDSSKQVEAFKSFSIREMHQVREVSSKIQYHPESNYCITALCREFGISPGKLQEGFKILHANTVNNTIKMFRLEKAEELIRESDMNISEVVYSIGFTSRSYFSKIFKKRYNCCPNHYRNSQMLTLESA